MCNNTKISTASRDKWKREEEPESDVYITCTNSNENKALVTFTNPTSLIASYAVIKKNTDHSILAHCTYVFNKMQCNILLEAVHVNKEQNIVVKNKILSFSG